MTKPFSSLSLGALCALTMACHLEQGGSQKNTAGASPDVDADASGPGGSKLDAGTNGGGTLEDGGALEDGGQVAGSDAASGASDGSPGVENDAAVACSGDPHDPRCAFQVKRKITFDGTGLSNALVDFPVLITLDPTRIDYSKTQAGGRDLRFVDSDGTLLAHDIERWQVGGTSFVWVKVPRFAPAKVHDIYMFYGNPRAPAVDRRAQVFSAGYEAVYHLADGLSDHVVRDVLGRHDGTAALGMDAADSVEARIGKGISLDGMNHRVEFGSLNLSGFRAFTLELWLLQEAHADARLLCQAESIEDKDHVLCLGTADESARVFIATDGEDGETNAYDAQGLTEGAWMHVAVAWDAQSHLLRVLKNGAVVDSFEHDGETVSESLFGMVLGNVSLTDPRFVNGVVDEVRISRVARSNLWLTATVATVNDNVAVYGPEEPVAP